MAASEQRLPEWFKVKAPGGEAYARIKSLKGQLGLATVCEEARCPNIAECWNGGTATFMLMGETCTRGCGFCAIDSAREGQALDPWEPHKLAHAIEQMDLDYAVLTMVNRDELPDQGAGQVAACIRKVKEKLPNVLVEMLIGDFQGEPDLLDMVFDSGPDVLAHNVETVRRLTHPVRDARADYDQSLEVLAYSKERYPERPTKSSIMVGLGETMDEVVETMRDLRDVGVEFLTIGQYLRPSSKHLQVADFVPPDTFDEYRRIGEDLGFVYVASGPLVRSSYRAGEYYIKNHIEETRVPT